MWHSPKRARDEWQTRLLLRGEQREGFGDPIVSYTADLLDGLARLLAEHCVAVHHASAAVQAGGDQIAAAADSAGQ